MSFFLVSNLFKKYQKNNRSLFFVMSLVFNSVKLCVVNIYQKPWIRAKEVCKALEYAKTTKVSDIVKCFCTKTNYALKCQLDELTDFVGWPANSRKNDYYVNEKGIDEILFLSRQPKARDFKIYCCNVLFPYFRQQLAKKVEARIIDFFSLGGNYC